MEIVFGMSDGVVSIFGLVLSVAAGAQSGNVVFLAGARVVCIAATATLPILLGIGRARIGSRPVARTVFETIVIATAAAIAGVLIGQIIS